MTEPVTFAQLCRVLDDLGFQKSSGPKDYTIYRKDATGTILYYPPHRTNDLVSDELFMGTRKLLLDHGVIDEDELEQLLQPVAA